MCTGSVSMEVSPCFSTHPLAPLQLKHICLSSTLHKHVNLHNVKLKYFRQKSSEEKVGGEKKQFWV